ncbi:MAG TPA: hypothetical protein VMU81_00740 [Acetobacteraceae bacterium]|jgi:uncharacterized membrane protein (DUF485 family)|nr:hypothetical protein [Acetobacteraceae bacterium]
MRTLRLARIAAEAEGLRLRRQAQRMVVRAVIACIALVLLLWGLALAHVAAWFAIRVNGNVAPWATALIMAGGDAVIALFLLLITARSSPGQVEQEALEVRRRALENATTGFAFATILLPVLRLAMNLARRSK